MKTPRNITPRGSGGKGGGASAVRLAVESKDTLRSRALAHIVDAQGEGTMHFRNSAGEYIWDAELQVKAVGSNGEITEIDILNRGFGYPVNTTFDCTVYGAGSGALIRVQSDPTRKFILNVIISNAGTGYAVGTTQAVPPSIAGTSIYLDDVPLVDPDDLEPNFEGLKLQHRTGEGSAHVLDNIPFTESSITTGVTFNQQITLDNDATFVLTGEVYDALRIGIAINRLYAIADAGGYSKSNLKFQITYEYQSDFGTQYAIPFGAKGSQLSNPDGTYEIDGLTSSTYQYAIEAPLKIDKTSSSHQWTFTIRRLSPEATNEGSAVFKEFALSFLVGIKHVYVSYNNTSVTSLELDSQSFRSIPRRTYRMSGPDVYVPSHYHPRGEKVTDGLGTVIGVLSAAKYQWYDVDEQRFREESANSQEPIPWDGSFRQAPCDNPAWWWYTLCVHPRYGLGGIIKDVNKWDVYRVARYCDQLVPDGFGGYEPRFTINMYIQNLQEAYDVLRDVASVMRAIMFWAGGKVGLSQFSPKETVDSFGPSNVEEGIFSYTGTSKSVRHTMALVKYRDRRDFFKIRYEMVIDHDAVLRYGVQQKEMHAIGATSRGEARRYGLAFLAEETLQSDVVSFRTGLQARNLELGSVFEVYDPDYQGAEYFGRIAGISETPSGSVVHLDRPHRKDNEEASLSELQSKIGPVLVLVDPQGRITQEELDAIAEGTVSEEEMAQMYMRQIKNYEITSIQDSEDGNLKVFINETIQDVATGTPYGLQFNEEKPRLFQTIGLEQIEDSKYEVTGVEYVPEKWDRIDEDGNFSDLRDTPLISEILRIGKVTNVNILVTHSDEEDVYPYLAEVSWSVPTKGIAVEYLIYIREGFTTYRYFTTTPVTHVRIPLENEGYYYVRIVAVGVNNVQGPPVARMFSVFPEGQNVDEEDAVINDGILSIPELQNTPLNQYEKVTGLELLDENLEGLGNIDTFDSPDCVFAWRTNSIFNYLPINDQAYLDQTRNRKQHSRYWSNYVIRVYDPTTGLKVFEDLAYTNNYRFTFKNNVDSTIYYNTLVETPRTAPFRTFKIAVSARMRTKFKGTDPGFIESVPETMIVTNPKPDMLTRRTAAGDPVGFEYKVSANDDGTLLFQFPPFLLEKNIEGFMIWISDSEFFDPELVLPVHKGSETQISVTLGEALTDGKTYYIEAAAYDSFAEGSADVNVSDGTDALPSDPNPPHPSIVGVNLIERDVEESKVLALTSIT